MSWTVRSQTLARPWVTRQAVATRIAWAAGRADALPTVSGTVRVRKSKAAGLAPGSLIGLSFSQNGVTGLVARVESITVPSPAKPEVTISFREDRAFLNHPHYLPPEDSDPVDEPFGTAPLSHEAVIELPYALTPDQNRHWLAALAARGDNLTNGMKVWVGADKLQPFTLQHERELASIAPLPFTLQYRARRPLCPLNLRANGDGWNPTYATGQGITVWYDGTDPRRSAEGPTATLIPDIEVVTVEMLTTAGELRAAFQYTTYGAKTISNTQIIAALGSETDFVLRAWFEGGGRRSLEPDTLTVRKV